MAMLKMKIYGYRLRALLSTSLSSSPFHSVPSRTFSSSSFEVLNVYNGPDGLLQGGDLLTPQLFIDSSTIDPQTSRKLAVSVSNCILKEKKENWENPVMLDAPVSGGVVAAEAGSLTFMVGGSEDVYLAAKSLLLSMGKNAIFCGGPGNGSVAKICNNLAMAISMLGLSEALALGQSLGITASTLTKIFNSSSARCWSRFNAFNLGSQIIHFLVFSMFSMHSCFLLGKKSGGGERVCSTILKYAQCDSDSYNPVPGVMQGVPSSRNYSGGFASKLMAKDLNLAAASAEEVGQRFPLTFLAQNIYTEICNDGHETEDFSCVFQHYYSGKGERN
ncbi:hypothetical protein Goklo_016026 [Gossypium klotzschianum]|uniref:3-hydroxyisobutyrate dehydrogenase n=1 Tax=Gossypium klotzschianum TaxID=34286 RepID=A0A7J8UDC2_9ROSI|nr:hypothetical protein [Gossypium klotzschianum]